MYSKKLVLLVLRVAAVGHAKQLGEFVQGLSDSEIMTILLYFGTFRNFKHFHLFFIKGTMKSYFPKA